MYITLTAEANFSWFTDGINKHGHANDTQGYNEDGYDVRGLDRNGNPRPWVVPFRSVPTNFFWCYREKAYSDLPPHECEFCVFPGRWEFVLATLSTYISWVLWEQELLCSSWDWIWDFLHLISL